MSLSKTFLAVGIAIVFAAFVAYGLNVVYEPPKYDYSQNDCYLKYDCYKPVNECQKQYTKQSANETPAPPIAVYELPPEYPECYTNITQTPEFRACQESLDRCNEEFEKQGPKYGYSRNVFFILLVIGISAVIGGSKITKTEGVSSGFIGGGVLVILWALVNSFAYWYRFDKYLKLSALGVVLAILIFIAYKKMDKEKK